jgi:hypothetical protein
LLICVPGKIADDVLPPDAVMKALTLLSKVMPKAKLFPNKDLAELAFREPSKRKLVSNSYRIKFNTISLAYDFFRIKSLCILFLNLYCNNGHSFVVIA